MKSLKHIKKVIRIFQFTASLLISSGAYSQSVPLLLEKNPLYSHQKDIINGIKWVYEMKYRGSPFLSEKYWPTATVEYDSREFTGVRMNYDLYTGKFIVYIPEKGNEKYVVPSKDRLEGFSYKDSLTGIFRRFRYFQAPGTKEKRLYEVAWKGESILYLVRRQVNTHTRIANGYLGDYVRGNELYFVMADQSGTFRNKRSLFILLNSHLPELRKFIRRNKLKINPHHPDDVVPLLKYYEKIVKEQSGIENKAGSNG